LAPTLYLLYTHDIPIPKLASNKLATFADDTAVMAVGENSKESTKKLQGIINQIQKWTKRWRIKLNESKSVHVDFTNKKTEYCAVYINKQAIPYAIIAKYLGITLDTKVRWKAHVKQKREELGIKYRKMYWLMGRHSHLSIYNKILLYKQILKSNWTYEVQLWGCTKQSNSALIQHFQNMVLRSIVNHPGGIPPSTLQTMIYI